MREPELLALMRVRDGDAAVLVSVAVDDLFGLVADDDDELGSAAVDQVIEDVLDERRPVYFDEHFGLVVGEWSETRALSGGEYNCLHDWYVSRR